MQAYWLSLHTIIPLFFVILAGILFSRTKAFKKEWINVLNDYALWVGFPALILVALIKLNVPIASYLQLAAWNSGYIVLCMLLAFPVGKILKLKLNTTRTLILAFSFGNVAYLGIPVLMSVYGDEILPESTVISAVYLFWLFTLGIILVEFTGGEKPGFGSIILSLLKNPLLLAVFGGLGFSVLNVEIPLMVLEGLDLIASSVTAIVLFSLGLFLGSQPIGTLKEWLPVSLFSLVILIILPYLYMETMKLSGSAFDFRSSVLEAAMPMGLTPYVLSVKYELNATFASRVVVMSTSLAIFTLPLWIIIL